MSSTSSPSYNEIYESVLDKVERKIAESKNLADREAFAQDIMDALSEAYSIGVQHQVDYTRNMLSGQPNPRKANPYKRSSNV